MTEETPRIESDTVVAAVPRHIAADLGGESVLLALDSGTYYGFDAVGARIWSLLQQPRAVNDIRDELLAYYDVDPQTCERDLAALLEKLAAEGLIETRSDASG